jgi:hypothetical protein
MCIISTASSRRAEFNSRLVNEGLAMTLALSTKTEIGVRMIRRILLLLAMVGIVPRYRATYFTITNDYTAEVR